MTPTPVEVTTLSGEALDWLKLVMVAQLGVGLVLVVVTCALLVFTLWAGR